MAERRRSTLRQRLVALFAVLLVAPLFASNLWGYLQSRAYLTDHAFRNVRDVAALEASQTLLFVDAKRDLVPLVVAGNLDLFGLLRSLQSQKDPRILASLQAALHHTLEEKVAEDEDAQEFFVLSPTGALMASSRGGHALFEDRSGEPCLHAGKQGPRVVGFEYTGSPPTLVVAAPVDDEFGTSWGVFCARFAFHLHDELEAARLRHTPEGSLLLLDASGRVVDAAREPGDAGTAPGSRPSRPFPVVGGSGPADGRYTLPSGEEALGAYAPVPSLGWGVLAEVPESRALASLTRLKWQAAAMGSLLTALLLVAVLFAAQGLSSPIKRLATAARVVAGGKLGERVPAGGPREVQDLADSFNQMSVALRDSHQLLEQRIAAATAELRRNQEFTELLLNSIDQRVVVIDRSLHVIKANRAALTAYGEAMLGRRCDEPYEGRPALCDGGAVQKTFETGELTWTERSEPGPEAVEIVRQDTLPVSGPERVEAVLLVGRVVTAEKRLQAELLHHEKMAAFGLLAAGMAHEIGNPLASIAAQLRMNREATEPERVRRTFEVVEREVERVSRLLRDLVNFARRRRDDVALVQLNEVVEDVCRLVVHDARARGVRIETELTPGLPGVRAKEDHLVQVLLNLSLNAIDALGGRGTLRIETALEGGEVRVSVKDSGPGIPAAVLPRIFEPFFTTKPAGRGTGLGLFVSRDIVEGMGGRLEVASTGPEGTVFVIHLQAATAGRISA